VPFAESVGALADLQRLGKIRHIGISNVTVAQLEMARSITPIVSVQNEYNLQNRTSEDVLAACERLGIAFLPWYPLGGKRGLKARKIKQVASRRGLTDAPYPLLGCSRNPRLCCQFPALDPSITLRTMCLQPPSSLYGKT
jgi:pyridoxine 4-dehydrogenase